MSFPLEIGDCHPVSMGLKKKIKKKQKNLNPSLWLNPTGTAFPTNAGHGIIYKVQERSAGKALDCTSNHMSSSSRSIPTYFRASAWLYLKDTIQLWWKPQHSFTTPSLQRSARIHLKVQGVEAHIYSRQPYSLTQVSEALNGSIVGIDH